MDFSIASALYFAARGVGHVYDTNARTKLPFTTPSRVLLSGFGADELFAGYRRHAIAFQRTGFRGLAEELELDFKRLGRRNLGRDDRVIAHWGKEVRYPYLDEDLLRWALACPMWEKCGFREAHHGLENMTEELEPGKKILRLLAQRIGLVGVAKEPKRA
ncbi:MAG: hypothetical protein M1833_007043, partial [Piccolia ochrophora]